MNLKLKTLFAAGAIITMGVAASSAYRISEYKAAPPVEVRIPVAPDSSNSENTFKIDQFLNSRRNNPYAALGWTTLVPGPDGKLQLAQGKENPEFHTLSTRLRADRFAKGKLVLNSNTRASVKVNGEEKITNADDDSIKPEAKASLSLNPQADYEIIIDLLTDPKNEAAPEISLEFIPDAKYENVSFQSGGDMKGRVSQASAIEGERVNRVSMSSNGKYVILNTSEVTNNTQTIRRASLIETTTGRVLMADLPAGAQWIPGECAYTSVVSRKDAYDVYRTEVPSFETRLIARDVPDRDFTILPGSRYLLYYDEVEAESVKGPMKRIVNPDDRIPGDKNRNYIVRLDLETNVAVPVTYGGPSTMVMAVNHDGSKFVYSAVRQTPDHFPFYAATLVEVDAVTLKCDTLIRNFEQTMTDVSYSPDGRQLFIIAGPDAFGGIGANYGDHEIGNDFDGQGYIFDIATRKARAVTRDFDPALISSNWNYADGNIYMLGETGFFQYIYRLDPKTYKITRLDSDLAFVKNFSMPSDNKEWLAYWGGSFTADGEAYLYNRRTGKSKLLSAPLREMTDRLQFGEMQPWDFTAADGSKIEGWFCLPPDFDPAKKYPLIVYYYGGTSPTNATFYHNYSPQVLASRDYVVYTLNPSGTTGYGQEFSARHVNAWGKRTAEEIIEGTKKFCETHPYVDSKKIGCIGASYGGFMTQYLLTRTDMFAAAVSHAGISNVTSYWGEGFWGYSYNSVAAARHYPWSDPDLFTKQGSLFNADKIHTPLLLLHGSEDTNVPIGESIQIFNALKILGRDVEFITVEGENHVIRGYDNRLIWQNTIMAWFAKYLQNDPNWWNSLY